MSIQIKEKVNFNTQRLLKEYKSESQSQKALRIRDKIVELNAGLVHKEAHHWCDNCSENYDDLSQIGFLGLITAIERFECDKAVNFSTFAIPYIRGQILHYLRDKSNSIRIPRRCLNLQRKAKKMVKELRNELQRQPNELEICQKLGISTQEWEEVKLAQENTTPISLDNTSGEEEEGTRLVDLLSDQDYRSFELAQSDQLLVKNAFTQLEDKTRQVLEFVFLQDLSYKKTGEKLGISATTVSRNVKKGLDKMKNIIKSDKEE